jgi:acyl carrier protein
MTNLEMYNAAFKSVFEVADEDLGATLEYQSVPSWDSVGHMTLIAELEGAFDIMMEIDDIISFSSYEKGKEILKKYNVEL